MPDAVLELPGERGEVPPLAAVVDPM